jgi:hypothetical protein
MRDLSDVHVNDGQVRGKSGGHEMTKTGWIGIGVTVLAAVLTYGLFLRHGVAPAVIGYNLVPAERVLSGEVPYRDFIYNYTPGVLWLNASLFKFLGTGLMTARLGVWAAKLTTAVLIYYLARRYMSGWLALLPVLMTLCWVGCGDILKVFPTQYGMALLLGAWAMLNKSEGADRIDEVRPGQDRASPGRDKFGVSRSALLGAAGMLGGAVLLFKQNVGVFACVAIVLTAAAWAWLVQDSNSSGRASPVVSSALAVLAGIAMVAGPAAIYLARRSALAPMLDHFRRHAVAYEEAKGIALPAPSALAASGLASVVVAAIGLLLFKKARRMIPSYSGLVSLLLLVAITIGDRGPSGGFYRSLAAQVYYLPIYATLAGAIWIVVVCLKGNRARAAGLIGVVLIPAAAFIEVFPRSDPDHLVRVLPPTLLLVCVLVHELGQRLVAEQAKSAAKAASPEGDGAAPVEFKAQVANNTGWRVVSARPRTWESERLFPSFLVTAVAIVIAAIGLRVTWAPQFDRGFRMVENRPLEFERARGVRGSELEADRFNRLVEYVQQHTSPGDPIFTTARKMTALYFFAGRPNTTRLLWFDSAGIPRQDRELVYQAIGERKYKLILTGGVGNGSGAEDADPDQQPATEAYEGHIGKLLKEHYHETALIDGISIFEPKQERSSLQGRIKSFTGVLSINQGRY